LKLSSKSFTNKIDVTVTVKNTGKVAGKEVVQLYLRLHRKNTDKPSSELKAFAKTNVLNPGESQTITMTLKPSDLALLQLKNA
jgi:beta-glucosidase